MKRILNNKRGAINLQTSAVLPILLVLLIGASELFIYYYDLQIVNTALDQGFRVAQIDGYLSDDARLLIQDELLATFMVRDYELTGTQDQQTWGESVEINFTTSRTMYITSLVEFTVERRREGLSEYWPGHP